MWHTGGDLLVFECCTLAWFNKGDIIKSSIWTSTAGAVYKVRVWATPIMFE